MTRHWLLTWVMLLLSWSAWAEKPTAVPDGFVALCNGRDLSGWKPTGKAEVWGVDQGVLFCKGGGGGWLLTEKDYSDFEARFEYKLPPMGNSGFALRTPSQGDPAYVGMEIQLIDEANWKGLRPTQLTGAIYDVVAPSKSAVKPAGEWNRMRIVCRGRSVSVTVNDVEVVQTQLDEHKAHFEKHPGLKRESGKIGFQSYNHRVEFRNIVVKDLSSR